VSSQGNEGPGCRGGSRAEKRGFTREHKPRKGKCALGNDKKGILNREKKNKIRGGGKFPPPAKKEKGFFRREFPGGKCETTSTDGRPGSTAAGERVNRGIVRKSREI